jgi:hypothetical protein
MPTPTERRIAHKKRNQESGALLVPILEKLLERECIPEDDEDFGFLDMLVRVRAQERAKGVFSPSMLGSCLRQAWFSKRGEEKLLAHSPQTNGYFLTGNFIHFKWQFAIWKAHRAGLLSLYYVDAGELATEEMLLRPAVEVRVIDGTFGGTIDVIVVLETLQGKPRVVDFKGVNLIDWQRTVKNGAPLAYRRQIVGYSDLAERALGVEFGDPILISECKAGPVSGIPSPLALHETIVSRDEWRGDVKRRLKTLRWYDDRDEMPPPECVSTRHMSFQECPFSRHCREEVRERQREHEAQLAARAANLRVARG